MSTAFSDRTPKSEEVGPCGAATPAETFGEQTLANLQVNTMADGLFHAVTWLFVAVGVAVLWRTARAGVWRTSWRSLLGWMLVGWGAFNLIEGTVNSRE